MTSDKEIVKGCRKGKAKYQRMLLERYSSKLMAVAYRYTSSLDDSKDVLQEAWIRIFNNFSKYEERGSLFGWLKTIVIHQSLKMISKKNTNIEIQDQHEHQMTNTHAGVIEKMTADEILSYVHKMPEIPRIVFTMKIIDGYAHKDIAEFLNITESTSRVHLTNARKRLSKAILENNKIAL